MRSFKESEENLMIHEIYQLLSIYDIMSDKNISMSHIAY